MAWRRDQSSSFISGSTIYAYTEVDWNVGASRCTYTHLGGVTSPYYWDTSATGTLFWREWSGGAWGAWNEYASGTAHFGGYGDKELVRTDDFFARQAADREVQLACDVTAAGGTGSAWLTYTVPHLPNAPASITATRVSDNQVTVSWTAPTRSYDAMCLEVSIDGGSWSEFTQLWNASTSTTYSQASADHSYRFRARAYYQSAYSDYTSPTAAVAMTPSTPQSISVAASGGTNVAVTMTNNSPVATSLEYQTSTDGGSTWSASTTVSGSPVTSFSTSVSGTALIRVRNKNATGVSDWLVSDPITTICPPAPPTLRTPSGSVYDMSQGDIEFSWLHNSLDGSTQSAYELRYSINGGAWTTLSGTTSQSRTVSIGTFSVGNAVTWQVRTKGADASYGEWSQTRTFNVYTAPTLSITSPGATITGMPISLTATYSDMAGFTCQAATVSLTKDGRTLYSEAATINGSSITASLTTDEFLPTNGESYTVVLTARSSSGLSTSANATFTVDFVEPQAGELSIVNDPDTGYASLLATFDNHASEITYTGSTNAQFDTTEGYVRSLTVEGKSEKWNQMIQEGLTSATEWPWWSMSDAAYTNGEFTGTLTGGYGGINNRAGTRTSLVVGRKYFLSCQLKSPTLTRLQFGIGGNVASTTIGTSWTNAERIITAAEGAAALQFLVQGAGTLGTFSFRNPVAIDLTAIFGSGNEPATVDAFKATDVYKAKLAAGELYDYDAGSLVSIEGVKVIGRNLITLFDKPFNDSSYWRNISTSYLTKLDDGWCHVSIDNSSGSGSAYANFWTAAAAKPQNLKPSTLYTWLVELRNAEIGTNCWVTINSVQPSVVDMFDATVNFSPTEGGIYRLNATTKSSFSSSTSFCRGYISVVAGKKFEADMRVSLYEGTYTGAYEPYSLTTITTPLRSAGSIHDTLMADADSWTVGRKVGVVDLGSLTWNYASNRMISTDLASTIKKPATDSTMPDIMASAKRPIKWSDGLANNHDGIAVNPVGGQLYCYAADNTDTPTGTLFYAFNDASQTTDTETSMSRIEIGSAFTVATDLDSTFEMTTWDGSADAVSISVARVNPDGTITPLLTDGASGSGIVDRYAPLNTTYQYAVTTKASSQAVKTVYVDNIIESDYWFAYWGENVAKAKWNPDNGGIQVTRPSKTRVYYAGRRDPVSYDGHAVALTETPSWVFIGKSEVDAFVRLIEDGGRGVYKSCDGWVYHADFDLTLTPSYTAIGYYGGASLGITRIAGERL